METSFELKQQMYELSKSRAKHTIWISSDIQQFTLQDTNALLKIVGDDFPYLNAEPEMIWFLGDAIQKSKKFDNVSELAPAAQSICHFFDSFGIPVCMVMGNHDLDYGKESGHELRLFMWEEVKKRSAWHTIERMSDFYFTLPLGDEWTIYFFSDCIDEGRAWYTTHGGINGDANLFPYQDVYLQKLREKMRSESKKIITAAHYAYPGGNRPSALLAKIMPLPENVKMHFYGHAHISDLNVCYESAYKRMCWADWHDIPMFDCASISNKTDTYSRTVILHIYEDGGYGVFWRNHDAHRFEEFFIGSSESMKEGLSDYLATHPDYHCYH